MGKRKKTTKKAASDDLVVFNSDQNEDTEGAVRQYKPLPGRIEKGEFRIETFDVFECICFSQSIFKWLILLRNLQVAKLLNSSND